METSQFSQFCIYYGLDSARHSDENKIFKVRRWAVSPEHFTIKSVKYR